MTVQRPLQDLEVSLLEMSTLLLYPKSGPEPRYSNMTQINKLEQVIGSSKLKNWRKLSKHFPHKGPEELRAKFKEFSAHNRIEKSRKST
jgi:hypothetical protein